MTPGESPVVRDVKYLARYLNCSRQLAAANATKYGGWKVGRYWRFTDQGIADGIARLAAQAAPAHEVPRPRQSGSTAERIRRQLAF